MLLLVATLTIRRDALDSFREFEHEAARIMAKHGGKLEKAIIVRAAQRPPPSGRGGPPRSRRSSPGTRDGEPESPPAPASLPGEANEHHKEIHIVSFPSDDAYEAYRVSPELAAFMHLREVSVVKTELVMGDLGPAYGQER